MFFQLIYFCHDKLQIERVVEYENTGINIIFLSAKIAKTGGFRDQISTKTHAAISFKKCAFKSLFPKVYFKSGPRVHRPPRF